MAGDEPTQHVKNYLTMNLIKLAALLVAAFLGSLLISGCSGEKSDTGESPSSSEMESSLPNF